MAVRLHKRKKKKKRAHNIDASKRKIVIEEILLWKCNTRRQHVFYFLLKCSVIFKIQKSIFNFSRRSISVATYLEIERKLVELLYTFLTKNLSKISIFYDLVKLLHHRNRSIMNYGLLRNYLGF
jgi:hypothetical protein